MSGLRKVSYLVLLLRKPQVEIEKKKSLTYYQMRKIIWSMDYKTFPQI